MEDLLRSYWDFDDLEATELRFEALLEEEMSAAGKAEILTQLARVEGLRGAFDRADGRLDRARELAGSSEIAAMRISLERGRVRRSSGEVELSLPLFESAFASASSAGHWFIAADAAHMAALAAPDRDGFVSWTRRGVEIAETQESAAHWLGPLLNNLGWELYEAGEHAAALDAFERALGARERAGDEGAIEIARYAVAKTLNALGRPKEAASLLEPSVACAEHAGVPDGWFHEELAESYAALGRGDDAREQARRALPLLLETDPPFAGSEREARLRSLSSDPP